MKVTVQTDAGPAEFENDTIENVLDLIRQAGPLLGININQNLAVNGAPATGTTPLADGDVVSTTAPAGQKGK